MIRAPMKCRFVLLSALLALGGCAPSGGGGVDTGRFRGDAKAVAQTLDDLATAGRKKDGQRACAELLSHRRVDALDGRGGCRKLMEDQFDDADVFKLDVKAIRVTGDRASARVVSDFDGDQVPRTLGLVREDRRWRLDSVRP
jgi:hypothetical protein